MATPRARATPMARPVARCQGLELGLAVLEGAPWTKDPLPRRIFPSPWRISPSPRPSPARGEGVEKRGEGDKEGGMTEEIQKAVSAWSR